MRRPIAFDPLAGYPAGPRIFYECAACGESVRSMPRHDEPWVCKCRNISVDGDAGRVSVRDHAQLRVYEAT